jgi:hypothetical protein
VDDIGVVAGLLARLDRRSDTSHVPPPTCPVDDVLRYVLQLVAIVAPVLALATYWRNAKTKRAEWLLALHAKFFESAHYKKMRHIIDYEPAELATLRDSVAQGGSDELVEDFVAYLNFFEFIASLWKLGQLNTNEVAMMFEYYLKNLASHPFITDFVAAQGFESLAELLPVMKQLKVGRR